MQSPLVQPSIEQYMTCRREDDGEGRFLLNAPFFDFFTNQARVGISSTSIFVAFFGMACGIFPDFLHRLEFPLCPRTLR